MASSSAAIAGLMPAPAPSPADPDGKPAKAGGSPSILDTLCRAPASLLGRLLGLAPEEGMKDVDGLPDAGVALDSQGIAQHMQQVDQKDTTHNLRIFYGCHELAAHSSCWRMLQMATANVAATRRPRRCCCNQLRVFAIFSAFMYHFRLFFAAFKGPCKGPTRLPCHCPFRPVVSQSVADRGLY